MLDKISNEGAQANCVLSILIGLILIEPSPRSLTIG